MPEPGPKADPGRVKLLVLDCDGVLTDGTLTYGPGGEVLQRFSARDGYGVRCLMDAGVGVAILTGKSFGAVRHRARTMGVTRLVQGADDKLPAIEELARSEGVDLAEVGYVGDDLLDLAAIRAAGWTAAPADAAAEVRDEVDFVSAASGGSGAVREVAELILRARGAWPPASRR